MSGAKKHAERSRYSHHDTRSYGIYKQFERHAYMVESSKEANKNLGQRLASLFRKTMPAN